MRRPRSSLVAALLGACLILGACNQGGSNESSGTEPAASTAEAAQSQESSVPGVSIHRRTDSPAPPSPSPSASARPAPATVPAGYATVTAPTAGITFAAPADWQVISASEIQTDESKLEEVANAAGVSADALKTAMSTADIYILDQSGTQDFSNNINVLSQTYPANTTVTEDALAAGVKSIGATPGRFSTESTANGDAYVLTYTWDLGGHTLQGAAMYVPNAKGEYVSITITTLDSALTDQIAAKIITTAA